MAWQTNGPFSGDSIERALRFLAVDQYLQWNDREVWPEGAINIVSHFLHGQRTQFQERMLHVAYIRLASDLDPLISRMRNV